MFLDVTLNPREEEKEEVFVKPRYDWRYENSINSGKLLDIESQEFKYNQWRTNISLSNFYDVIFIANFANLNYHLSDELHYHYLFHSVRKKKRYNKKKTEEDKKAEKEAEKQQEIFNLIQTYYKYNNQKTRDALRVLTKEQIKIIVEKEKNKG